MTGRSGPSGWQGDSRHLSPDSLWAKIPHTSGGVSLEVRCVFLLPPPRPVPELPVLSASVSSSSYCAAVAADSLQLLLLP